MTMKAKFRLWIENADGEQLFGEGLLALLTSIEKTGSLNKASQALDMSYRAAWGRLEKAEKRLGFTLVERKIGGQGGGGSVVTEQGKRLLTQFVRLKRESQAEIDRLLDTIFDPL